MTFKRLKIGRSFSFTSIGGVLKKSDANHYEVNGARFPITGNPKVTPVYFGVIPDDEPLPAKRMTRGEKLELLNSSLHSIRTGRAAISRAFTTRYLPNGVGRDLLDGLDITISKLEQLEKSI